MNLSKKKVQVKQKVEVFPEVVCILIILQKKGLMEILMQNYKIYLKM
jgi:hypothetical protein